MTVQAERRARRKTKLKWYILGPLLAAISLPLLLYLCSLLLAHEVLPFGLMEELVITCVFFAGTAGAAAASGARGQMVMQTGLITGGILAAALVIVSLAVPGQGAFNAQCPRHVIAALAGGAFGGALRIKRVKRKNKKRRHK